MDDPLSHGKPVNINKVLALATVFHFPGHQLYSCVLEMLKFVNLNVW